MSPRQQVLKKFPTAALVKGNISSWGVFVPHANRWLSYGEATNYLAWRKAAASVTIDSGKARP